MEDNKQELTHHGIKGQKWGNRRFQNADGSLTAAGRKRYGVDGKSDTANKQSGSSKRSSFGSANYKQRKYVKTDESTDGSDRSIKNKSKDNTRFDPESKTQSGFRRGHQTDEYKGRSKQNTEQTSDQGMTTDSYRNSSNQHDPGKNKGEETMSRGRQAVENMLGLRSPFNSRQNDPDKENELVVDDDGNIVDLRESAKGSRRPWDANPDDYGSDDRGRKLSRREKRNMREGDDDPDKVDDGDRPDGDKGDRKSAPWDNPTSRRTSGMDDGPDDDEPNNSRPDDDEPDDGGLKPNDPRPGGKTGDRGHTDSRPNDGNKGNNSGDGFTRKSMNAKQLGKASDIADNSKKIIDTADDLNSKIAGMKNRNRQSKELQSMSNEELRKVNERLQLENTYKNLTKGRMSAGQQFVSDFLTVGSAVAGVTVSALTIAKLIKELKG